MERSSLGLGKSAAAAASRLEASQRDGAKVLAVVATFEHLPLQPRLNLEGVLLFDPLPELRLRVAHREREKVKSGIYVGKGRGTGEIQPWAGGGYAGADSVGSPDPRQGGCGKSA